MGNRAVITQSTASNAPCIYLHWNGGADSVKGFLAVAKTFDISGSPTEQMDILAELLAKHFFKCKVGLTVYRQEYGRSDTDNGDNGVYVVNSKWDLIDRIHAPYTEQHEWDSKEIAQEILKNVLADSLGIEREEVAA